MSEFRGFFAGEGLFGTSSTEFKGLEEDSVIVLATSYWSDKFKAAKPSEVFLVRATTSLSLYPF